ncbi:hypothetical protein [Geobacillus sp. FJAT-46040]|uniref:hypothetical protein n=1 Tax=Geobacillus sp. FJAT-46040 TaxID=2011017 RepID=UPI000BB93902|nr:hypothetical protein [Geobacillus sp. FJAT-46040]
MTEERVVRRLARWILLWAELLKRARDRSATLNEYLDVAYDALQLEIFEYERKGLEQAIKHRKTALRYTHHDKKRRANERLLKTYCERLDAVDAEIQKILEKYV